VEKRQPIDVPHQGQRPTREILQGLPADFPPVTLKIGPARHHRIWQNAHDVFAWNPMPRFRGGARRA
jgi:hypothetical protein